MDEAEQMHTVPEVAREMRVDRETVYRAIRRGELGTPLDPSKLTSLYVKKALKTAGITKPIQPWHGLRDTALTAFAVTEKSTPALVQARAGHAQGSITERYIHAAEVVIDGLADAAEERLFSGEQGRASERA